MTSYSSGELVSAHATAEWVVPKSIPTMMRSSVERGALWIVAPVNARARGILVREVNVRSPGETVDVDVVEVAMESERGDGGAGIFFLLCVFITHNTKQLKKSTEQS